jgi:hypothetical protein
MNWRVAEVVNVVPLMAMIRARAAAGSDVDTRLLLSRPSPRRSCNSGTSRTVSRPSASDRREGERWTI